MFFRAHFIITTVIKQMRVETNVGRIDRALDGSPSSLGGGIVGGGGFFSGGNPGIRSFG